MSAALRTATALLALVAFALPAGATAVQVLAECCEGHCPEHESDHSPLGPPGTDPASPAGGHGAERGACCVAPALTGPATPVVVPSPERPLDVASLAVPAVVPVVPVRALDLPARPPPPSVRPHLVHSVLLI